MSDEVCRAMFIRLSTDANLCQAEHETFRRRTSWPCGLSSRVVARSSPADQFRGPRIPEWRFRGHSVLHHALVLSILAALHSLIDKHVAYLHKLHRQLSHLSAPEVNPKARRACGARIREESGEEEKGKPNTEQAIVVNKC
ncbi:hypothetical protein MPH_11650 [Macrophomina phaseolina MS6]|uniref:Uncharacterized protein n=1 Tax=Macrophomina phaseolina (strain MS6) TaxID=1126212 RepID=K2RLY5_MACPH|nr:hypothetical protein MPH_11650 [Macrophomina phaseolina MS6]